MQPLSTLVVVVTLLSLAVGVVNVAVQTGKVLNQWPLPQKALPYFVTLGSFLAGAYTVLAVAPRLDAAAIFFAVVAGVQQLLVAASPGITAHLFGQRVNIKRPAPEPINKTTAPLVSTAPPAN